jgi:SpoVK/Ycf46/Vps4 family AAA+-type ATPase
MSAGLIRMLELGRLLDEPPPPVPWLVQWLVARGAVTMLAGPAGVGKSLLALAIASAVARGLGTIGGLPVTAGTVAVIDAENGERTLHERAHLLELPRENMRLGLAEGLNLRHERAVEEIVAALAPEPPALLVLDSLASLAPGLKENEADQAGPVLDRIRRFAQSTGTGILLLHHTRKDGDSYRGGTSIPAAVDIAAVYGRPRDADDRELRVLDWSHEKGGKTRLGPEPEPRRLRVGVTHGRLTIDEAEVPRSAEPTPRSTKRTELREDAVALIAEQGPLAQGELLKALQLGATDRTGRRALDDAVSAGELVRRGDGVYTFGRQGAKGACQGVAGGMAGTAPVGGPCLPATPEAEAELERVAAKFPGLEGPGA